MTAAAIERSRPRIGPVVIPLLALALFINYVDRGNLSTAAPLIKAELKLDASQYGALVSAFSWTYVAAMPVSGWLAERIGAYRTMAIGLGIWSLATLFTGFAGGFASILMLRMMLGVGESVAFPCSSKIISEHVEHRRLGAVNGLMSQGLSLGPAFGVFFGGLVMAQLGWRRVFLMFGALSLLWLIPWIVSTRRLTAAYHAEPNPLPAPSFRAILSKRELWGVTLGHLTGNYGFYFVIAWMPLYLVNVRGYSLAEMAAIGGVVYLVYAVAAGLGGWITDRWIASGATQGQARKTVATVAHLVGAAGLLMTPFGGRELALAGLFVTGIGFGLVSPHTFATAQVLAGPRATGKWMGVQNGIGNLSGIVGPLVTGMIIDRTGSYVWGFVLTAAVAAAGVAGWLLLIPRVERLDWKR
ncbi:MAG: MFS transporter [Phenylobacterium sp.]|nr:MAG: MFS transporter [Phenylobacterium sp.]